MKISKILQDFFFLPPEKLPPTTKLEVGDTIQFNSQLSIPKALNNKKYLVTKKSHFIISARQKIQYHLKGEQGAQRFLVCDEDDDGITYEISYPLDMSYISLRNLGFCNKEMRQYSTGEQAQLSIKSGYETSYGEQAYQEMLSLLPEDGIYTKKYRTEKINYGDGAGKSYSLTSANEKKEFCLEYWPPDEEDAAEYEYCLVYYAEEQEIHSIIRNNIPIYRFWQWTCGACMTMAIISFITSLFWGSVTKQLYHDIVRLNYQEISTQGYGLAKVMLENPFKITKPYQAYSVSVDSGKVPYFKWSEPEIEILDENKAYLYSFSDELWAEQGIDEDGFWEDEKTNYSVKGTFIHPGTYYIALNVYSDFNDPTITVNVSELNGSNIPHLKLSILLLLTALLAGYLKKRSLNLLH